MSFQSIAIVPAAGRSRRMGSAKLLLMWRGRTIIGHTLAAWRESDVDRVVVVTHPDDGPLAEVCRAAGAEVVVAQSPPAEMKDSIRLGLERATSLYALSKQDVWLMAPADMPRLSAEVANRLLAAHRPTAPCSLVPIHEGRRGHPVLLPWSLAPLVAQLPDDAGVNRLLEEHPLREIESTAAALPADLDAPEDFERLQDR